MSINAYCGIMGSGKSYEVISGPVLEAIARGRRVVTNVDGVREEAMHAYLAEKRGLNPSKLGRIVHVTTDRVREEGFFPVEVEGSGGATVTPGLVEPGDLLAIDEAWKLWATGEKLSKEHVSFFRMHRHFVNQESGLACDIVLMVQSVTDLHRMLKPVLELTFVMHKLKMLGASTRYRVEQYDGWKQNAKTRVATYYKTYNPEIFPLYKSYAGGAGHEAVVDARQNVLLDRKLWVVGGVSFVLFCAGLWGVARFFSHKPKPAQGQVSGVSAAGASAVTVPGDLPACPRHRPLLRRCRTFRTRGGCLGDSSPAPCSTWCSLTQAGASVSILLLRSTGLGHRFSVEWTANVLRCGRAQSRLPVRLLLFLGVARNERQESAHACSDVACARGGR
ncbi:zonular occludens toxin domain-containing protein [Burkholderia stabilis]|uniref:zonular occludens toxin domain-containing protein n=1 Tax=Burkholderia stabilis TaxID=95485 RepID=UPI001F15C66E|nr:zonular occludens toxin domain-containing protein [Burkholderia stabilis]